jgi:UDP-N-acetylglucosamine 2-epimerase (non-hydrolysing)
MLRILNIVGARPNFIKIAPILKEMSRYPSLIYPLLVNTGQHYDPEMVDLFFEDLEIPEPDISLGVGSGSHASQTARIMEAFEPVCLKTSPDLVLVVGDVNSTLACSLVSSKLGIRIAHVESGLRSFDRSMPEEINREVTDLLSDYLFTTCKEARTNLERVGVPSERIFFVGNVMIDSLNMNLPRARSRPVLEELRLNDGAFGLITLHRPSNVDHPEILESILDSIDEIQERIALIFPAHPRTVKAIRKFKFEKRLRRMKNLNVIAPLGYLDFLAVMDRAAFVLTDSGGIQEETTVLGIPCLTLRENTERPVTIDQGTNILVGLNNGRIIEEAFRILDGGGKKGQLPPLWDGKTSGRIVRILLEELQV